MIYLHKLLPILASPLFLILVLAVLGLFLRRRWINVLIVLVLLIGANPHIASKSRALLDGGYTYVPVETVEPVDAVIVLSGMLHAVEAADGTLHYERNGSIDRFEKGLEYIQKDKAETLILTRGFLPWSKGRPEGEELKEMAVNRGIPASKIILTEIAQNTDQEAQAIAQLLQEDQTAALVTSAFHMPRALRVFEARGLAVVPHAVDISGNGSNFTPMDILPTAGALSQNSLFVREMIGRVYYRLKYGPTIS